MSASSPRPFDNVGSEPSLADEKSESSLADGVYESSPSELSADERPVRYIIQNLERAYGVPQNSRRSDPLDMLIEIILSQATSDTNSRRTFAALKRRFSTWDAALRARESTIAA